MMVAFFICSAKIGTVELTGLEMIATMAFGQFLATAVAKFMFKVAFTCCGRVKDCVDMRVEQVWGAMCEGVCVEHV